MGACLSSSVIEAGSSRSDLRPPSANVISSNGDLHEYSLPVTVSHVLHMEFPTLSSSTNFFVCNSDSLYYDDYIPALDDGDELQADQIYFLLPASKLQYRLTASDMAALAVKASLALQKSSSNSKKDSSSTSFLRHRRQNKMVQISPVLEDFSSNNIDTDIQRGVSPSSDRVGVIVRNKKQLSDKPRGAPQSVSRSGSMRKFQRYSSRRAKKMAVRSFGIKLTTIEEGTVLQFY
ncbi:hypothetical protein U1Q18_006176 [Sarracenia purpurea var. burkii]